MHAGVLSLLLISFPSYHEYSIVSQVLLIAGSMALAIPASSLALGVDLNVDSSTSVTTSRGLCGY